MDSQNYVAPHPSGQGYVVVVGGAVRNDHPLGLNDAQDFFNQQTGQGGAQPAGPAAPGGGGQRHFPGKVYQTREGPRTIEDIQEGVRRANGTVSGDDEADVAAFNRAGGGSGSGGGGGYGGGGMGGGSMGAWADMMDAIATGNREKFAESVRQFNESLGEERRQFDVGATGRTGDPAQLNAGWGPRYKEIYRAVSARKGTALPPEDPDLVKAIAAEFGFSPQEAVAINRAGKDYFLSTGQEIPDQVLQAALNRARPFGDNPSLDARKFGEGQRQFDVTFGEGTRRYEQDFGESGRRFDQGQYASMAQTLLSALPSMRGPRDYAQHQNLLAGGRDVLSQLRGSTPQAAFGGMSGDPERARISDLLAGLGLYSQPFNQAQAGRTRIPPAGAPPGAGLETDVTPMEQQRRRRNPAMAGA